MEEKQVKYWLKENWFRTGILVVLLVVAYSIYHVLVVRPDIEVKEAAEAKMQAELSESSRKAKASEDLNSCIQNAESLYSRNWNRECKSRGELSSKCIDIQGLSFNDYLDKYDLTPAKYNQQRGLSNTGELSKDFLAGAIDYLKRREDECSCRLPLTISDRLDDSLKEEKNICYRE